MIRFIIFAIIALAFLIGSILRNYRARQNDLGKTWGERDDRESSRRSPPQVVRRRAVPPPLPKRRREEQTEIIVAQVAPLEPAMPVVLPAITKPLQLEKQPVSASVIKVAALLKHPQSLRSAIVVREVLDPPLCRRRRLR